MTAFALAANVKPEHATSSPTPMPRTTSARWSAAVPLESATACSTPATAASSASNASTCGPSRAARLASAEAESSDTSTMTTHGMVFLGFGKYVRADRIYALEPIVGEERVSGSRTLVWVEGIPEPVVASRTQQTLLEEIEASTVPSGARRRAGRGLLTRHPQLFEGE